MHARRAVNLCGSQDEGAVYDRALSCLLLQGASQQVLKHCMQCGVKMHGWHHSDKADVARQQVQVVALAVGSPRLRNDLLLLLVAGAGVLLSGEPLLTLLLLSPFF